MLHDSAGDGHAKDCLSGAACDKDHFPTVLSCDAICEGKSESGTLLLSFADKWLEHAAADVFRDTGTIILHFDGNYAVADAESRLDSCLLFAGPCGLACVEQQVVDGSFNLLAINQCCGVRGVAIFGRQGNSRRIGVGVKQR